MTRGRVRYWGPNSAQARQGQAFFYLGSARAAFMRLAEGLDTAVVRVVAATRSDIDGVRAAMRACAPARGTGAGG